MEQKDNINTYALSPDEEKLLMRFCDCEGGWLLRSRARTLIKRSYAAKQFVQGLKCCNESLQSVAESSAGCSLWDKIDARITQEERAALFLGERKLDSAAVQKPSWFERFRWSAAGAVAVSCLLVLGIYLSPESVKSIPGVAPAVVAKDSTRTVEPELRMVSSTPSGLKALSSESEDDIGTPVPLAGQILPRGIEVDWVRSHGRVTNIPDTRGRTAIIWVKRRGSINNQRRRVVGPQNMLDPRFVGTTTSAQKRK